MASLVLETAGKVSEPAERAPDKAGSNTDGGGEIFGLNGCRV